MSEPTVIHGTPADAELLAEVFRHAAAAAESFRLMMQDGGVKYSISRGSWSLPIGSTTEPGWGEPEPVAAPKDWCVECGHYEADHHPDGCTRLFGTCGCFGYEPAGVEA